VGRHALFWGKDEQKVRVEIPPKLGLRVASELLSLYCSGSSSVLPGHALNCSSYVSLTLDMGPMRGSGEARVMRLRQFGERMGQESGNAVFSRTAWKTRRGERDVVRLNIVYAFEL